MILSDRDIKLALQTGRVKIESSSASPRAGQPETFMHIHASSMDLHLGNSFKLYEHSKFAVIDPKRPETFTGNMRLINVKDGESYMVQPGEFVLGVTEEAIPVPNDLVVGVEGRSSLWRRGPTSSSREHSRWESRSKPEPSPIIWWCVGRGGPAWGGSSSSSTPRRVSSIPGFPAPSRSRSAT